MKLQGYRDEFGVFSGKASDVSRQLAFAGIALIWIFKIDSSGHTTVPPKLIWPGVLIVASLTLDLFQYFVGSVIWRCYYRALEKRGTREDVELPLHDEWRELSITGLFFLKVACVIAAYGFILVFLFDTLAS